MTTPNRSGPERYGVRCPKCGASIGRPCRLPGRGNRIGKERPPHPARVAAAKGDTRPDPDHEAAEIERRREASRRHLAAADSHHTEEQQ